MASNEHKIVKIYSAVTAIIAVGIAFFFAYKGWWPARQICEAIAGPGRISKWSLILTALIFYLPFLAGRQYLKKKYS
jgi:hypothetical protein